MVAIVAKREPRGTTSLPLKAIRSMEPEVIQETTSIDFRNGRCHINWPTVYNHQKDSMQHLTPTRILIEHDQRTDQTLFTAPWWQSLETQTFLLRYGSKVTTLRLQNMVFLTFRDFLELVCLFPAVENLSVICCRWSDKHISDVRSLPQLPTSIKAVDISRGFGCGKLAEWLVQPPWNSLDRLIWPLEPDYYIQATSDLFNAQRALTHLTLDAWALSNDAKGNGTVKHRWFLTSKIPDISQNPRLESFSLLHVLSEVFLVDPTFLSAIIGQICSQYLETILIELVACEPEDASFSGIDFGALERTLLQTSSERKQFPALRHVKFQVRLCGNRGPIRASPIPYRMPSLEAEGVFVTVHTHVEPDEHI